MHRDLLSALIANVRQRVAEGDCPVTQSYPVETLENAILDLADEAPAEGAGDGHMSDCAIHNAPALPVGPCDCGSPFLTPEDIKRAHELRADPDSEDNERFASWYGDTLLEVHQRAIQMDAALRARSSAPEAREEALGNLLAVIHGDGGHRALEVGTKQAALEAEKIVAGLFAAPSADKLQVLDAVGDYLIKQYGKSYGLHHPVDRARILAALEGDAKP